MSISEENQRVREDFFNDVAALSPTIAITVRDDVARISSVSCCVDALRNRVPCAEISVDQCAHIIRKTAQALLACHEFYCALKCAGCLDDGNSMVVDFIQRNGIRFEDGVDVHLAHAVTQMEGVTNQQVLDDVLNIDADDDDTDERANVPIEIQKVLLEVQKMINKHCDIHGLSHMRWLSYNHLNIAYYLLTQRRQYDAVIGIVNGGNQIPAILHPFGLNVGFIETHQNSTDEPRWVGNNPIQDGNHILLCDEDAVSGNSIRRVCAAIQKIHANVTFDMMFTDYGLAESALIARDIPSIQKILTAHSFNATRIFTNMLEMRNLLQELGL